MCVPLKRTEAIIVGGGIAGWSLAYRLYQHNVSFCLFDAGQNHSTAVAAGLINPLVFKRLTKSWKVDEFLPQARIFYSELEKITRSRFFELVEYYKIIPDAEWINNWESKRHEENFADYIGEITKIRIGGKTFDAGLVKNAFQLHTPLFLDALQRFFKECIIKEPFDYKQLEFTGEMFCYKNIRAEKIIFAEGYQVIHNPFFNQIPLVPTKGEVLTVANNRQITTSVNKDFFILPGKDTLTIGATYHWHNISLEPEKDGIAELARKYLDFIGEPPEIISARAGIRPAMKDRRPVLGEHPEIKNMFIFNGLGTKGCMTAPLLSLTLFRRMFEQKPLPEETDVLRFLKKL
jgi:glycine/D-amino acid oxidase-like deaminating enzyme